MTSSPCIYGEGSRLSAGPGKHCRPRWQSHLPSEWLARVVPPQSFRVHREHEVPARRVIGYDVTGAPCYCAYDYRLIEPRSDDDEEHYTALTYGESVRGWRLREGRWLVYRRLAPFGDDGDLITDLVLDDQMPR